MKQIMMNWLLEEADYQLFITTGPDPTPCRPAHMRTEEEMRRIRELDESNRAEPPLHQPRLNHMPIPGMSRDQLANQMGRMNIHQQVRPIRE